MAINKKISKEILKDLGLDKTTVDVILTVLNLKEKDFENEYNLKIQTAEKELEKAKEKFQEKKEKAQNDSLFKVINQTIKDLKIELPTIEKFEDVEKEIVEDLELEDEENDESIKPENTNFGNRDFNQSRY